MTFNPYDIIPVDAPERLPISTGQIMSVAAGEAPVPRAKAELVTGSQVQPIIPRTIDEVARVASAIIKAGLAPSSYESKTGDPQETASKIIIGIMKGAEVGLPPITALSTIAIINNRPCIWGDGAVALIQAKGAVESYEAEFSGKEFEDDWTCTVTIRRKNQEAPYVGKFSVADAKRAKLWMNASKQPWVLYPHRMLHARARAYALRDGFADCLAGLSISEEQADIAPAPQALAAGVLDDADEIKTEGKDAAIGS